MQSGRRQSAQLHGCGSQSRTACHEHLTSSVTISFLTVLSGSICQSRHYSLVNVRTRSFYGQGQQRRKATPTNLLSCPSHSELRHHAARSHAWFSASSKLNLSACRGRSRPSMRSTQAGDISAAASRLRTPSDHRDSCAACTHVHKLRQHAAVSKQRSVWRAVPRGFEEITARQSALAPRLGLKLCAHG